MICGVPFQRIWFPWRPVDRSGPRPPAAPGPTHSLSRVDPPSHRWCATPCYCTTRKLQTFFKKFLADTCLFWGHWYPWFGFLVMSPLGFKARVGSALFALWKQMSFTFPKIQLWCYICWPLGGQQHSGLLPHMRWDLARIQTGNHSNRRQMHYRCASNPAIESQKLNDKYIRRNSVSK